MSRVLRAGCAVGFLNEWMPCQAPVALDELVAVAGLQTRVDRKYVLRSERLADVLAELPVGLRVLDIAGLRSFRYESLYFDTPQLLSYRAAATGRARRFKIRTRRYVDSDTAYLEVKTRGGRSATVKDRVAYSVADARMLTPAGRVYVAQTLAEAGIVSVPVERLQPTLRTRYRRVTLLQPDLGSRATIDTNLDWELPHGSGVQRDDLCIVETKSGSRPSPVDRLLWRLGHRPATVSKYGTGLAALRPELPAHKWAPVLGWAFGRRGAATLEA